MSTPKPPPNPYAAKQVAYRDEQDPLLMLCLEWEPKAKIAIPYHAISSIEWQNPEDEFIAIGSGDKEFFLVGLDLTELYEKLLQHRVSFIQVAPEANDPKKPGKITRIGFEQNKQPGKSDSSEAGSIPPPEE